ncbi:hypothetical protein IHV25_07045 [Phaeovibrio sulfidiphilus]|uniref:Uncharacterized protein n=1 Tax=Phaeovibrio sulfidiphilus TaxID=1220600 RepID=A0A8J6YQF5_9PROT|nr:hypothetical protein [Phaeovibrio sulfidiphilus]MBE1237402.1 hypothetical protein [Phaeovibrio sulfidiphilus]
MAWTPDSYMTKEDYENADATSRLMHDLIMAQGRGDWATAGELLKQIDIPAEALMALKRTSGAERIRELGVKTATAEAKYGKDWLDR